MADLETASPARVRAALAVSGRLGMFFRLPDPDDDPVGWLPVQLLYSARTGQLDEVLAAARRGLRDCEPRVAASLFFQGYAARLLSPQLGCLVTSGCVPSMPPGQLRWRRPHGTVIELGMTAGPGFTAPADALVEHTVRTAFDHHLQPLADALRARVRIASSVLRDNAASALIGGIRLLGEHRGGFRATGGSGVSPGKQSVPPGQHRGRDWRALAATALAQPMLRGSGILLAGDPFFVRRSCCLYYRAPGGGTCADCPLDREKP
jgi:iron complex transport system ATP-binding protein